MLRTFCFVCLIVRCCWAASLTPGSTQAPGDTMKSTFSQDWGLTNAVKANSTPSQQDAISRYSSQRKTKTPLTSSPHLDTTNGLSTTTTTTAASVGKHDDDPTKIEVKVTFQEDDTETFHDWFSGLPFWAQILVAVAIFYLSMVALVILLDIIFVCSAFCCACCLACCVPVPDEYARI